MIAPAKLNAHIRACQSLIDTIAPGERSAWNETIGENPQIPVLNMTQLIACAWVSLSRLDPRVSYARVSQTMLWLRDPMATVEELRDRQPTEREWR